MEWVSSVFYLEAWFFDIGIFCTRCSFFGAVSVVLAYMFFVGGDFFKR